MFGRLSFVNSALLNASLATYQGLNRPERARNVVWQVDTAFTSNTINEFRVGYQRDYSPFLNQGAGGNVNFAQQLAFLNTTTDPRDFFAPSISLAGINSFGGSFNLQNTTNRYIISDSLSHIVGGHTLKWGAEIRIYRLLEEISTYATDF
jgi:hypothetical protein